MSRTGLRQAAVIWLWMALAAPATAAGPVALPASAQAGDLIFREGTEPVSAAVLAIDQDAPFSHVGMLVGTPENWQVLHATPAEIPGRRDGVVLDTLDFFIDARRTRRYAVYHVETADGGQRLAAVQAAKQALGQPFRIADPAGTYCTLLVWDAWKQAGLDLHVAFTPLRLPLLAGEYLLPSSLLASNRLTPL